MVVPNERVVVICNTVGEPPEVYHRDFPEIRSQGETVGRAAVGLTHSLERAMDSALTNWRRETLQLAIEEVQSFIEMRELQEDAATRTP